MPIKKRGKKPAKKRTARSTRRPRASTARTRTAGRRAASARGRTSARTKKSSDAGAAAALKARFAQEKSELERRLSDTVREITQLRHHEARVTQLERQLKERDELIGQLRTQLNDLRNREIAAPEDDEVQPSLALGSRSHDLDEFDDDVGSEEDDELI